jgi:hypothetical protein
MSHYWLTPPELIDQLLAEFSFDFDPCPYPRPDGYNSLVVPWGKCNYVNPPFNTKDAPFGGPSAFVRKAIEEQREGKTSVFVLPVPWNIGLLLRAGAELRNGGIVQWLDEHGNPCPRKAPQIIAVLRGDYSSKTKETPSHPPRMRARSC